MTLFSVTVPRTLSAVLTLVLSFSSPAMADGLKPTQTAAVDIVSDGSERINLADRLAMLTQRVAASSCALTSGIDVEAAHDILDTSAKEFERIVHALTHGDAELNIHGPETNRRMLADIEAIWEEWAPTREAIARVLADGHDVDSAHVIDDHNLELLDLTHKLIADVTGHYSHPFEMTKTDAMMIKIAGRQRMLTQKMAKDACEIWTHYHEETAIPDLMETKEIFERSLVALRDGMPSVGIQPAPTPEIRADLDRILERWAIIKGNQEILLAGGELDEAGRYEIFHDLQIELEELNVLVGHYTDFAERHH